MLFHLLRRMIFYYSIRLFLYYSFIIFVVCMTDLDSNHPAASTLDKAKECRAVLAVGGSCSPNPRIPPKQFRKPTTDPEASGFRV